MRQIISKNRVLLILSVAFAAFLLPFYGYAEEEGELLFPRAGDKLQKIELDVKTVSINDDKSIDLSSAKPIGDLKVEFFDCSKRNFGSDLAVVYNNQSSMHLRKTTGGFYVKREYKPGQFIDYDVCYPYLATGKNNYNGKGVYGLFMDVSVSGASTASWVSNNAKIVCADNDTLTECKVLALERMETRIVECGDSIEEVLHKGMVTKWFKQGFRYPIVELVEDALITQDSLTLVDKSVRCFYFPIESQVVQVTEDPDNEELRNNYIQYSKNEKGILYKGIEAGKLQKTEPYYNSDIASSVFDDSKECSIVWAEDHSFITVSLENLSPENYPIVVKVYDSAGKIYHIAKNQIKIQFDMTECVSGIYFVLVEQGNYSYVEKIVKR